MTSSKSNPFGDTALEKSFSSVKASTPVGKSKGSSAAAEREKERKMDAVYRANIIRGLDMRQKGTSKGNPRGN